VDSASASELRRIWADATPLSKFIEDRAEHLCREARPVPGRTIPKSQKLSPIEGMSLIMQYDADLSIARGKARKETVNHLVAGRIVGLGRRSGFHDIETIDASFWIGADVEPDAVSRDGTQIIDVRIVLPDVLLVEQPKQQSDLEAKRRAEVIREAIVDYAAKTDPDLGPPRSKRYKAYRAYISARRFDIKKRGFSDKRFEKAETEYRRESRRKSK
jgi:hypothetical protein